MTLTQYWPVAILLTIAMGSCTGGYSAIPIEQVLATPANAPQIVGAWLKSPVECVGCYEFVMIAYSDDHIVWRDQRSGGSSYEVRSIRQAGLVERIFGDEQVRQSFARLKGVSMPSDWLIADGESEYLCIRFGGELSCHALNNPQGFLIGRTEEEACRSGQRLGSLLLEHCERWHPLHARIPEAFAIIYRRAYDFAYSTTVGSSELIPPSILVEGVNAAPSRLSYSDSMYDPCGWRGLVSWPAEVPAPPRNQREHAQPDWTMTFSVGDALLLTETVQNSGSCNASCVSVHDEQWSLRFSFELPYLAYRWQWCR